VVYECHHNDSRVKELGQTCQTVTSRWGTGGNNVPLVSSTEKLVRRLTPIEVERLQGFPDDYTNIPWRGKTAPDSRR
ncbi:MAG TPA: DNA cytosine methyltransferase, partial [Maribacter sp.]|nr:DNA cytosine methyltransferase [Maribacter sp.]